MPGTARRAGGSQHIPRPATFADDDRSPWRPGQTWSVDELVATVPAHSAPLLPAFPDARISAVLIVLVDGDDGAEVLLTKRSIHLRSHGGEISFPGGRLDIGETPVEAALREAHEEVGLEPWLPRIVGELEHLNTVVSNSYIVPIVSTLDDRHTLRGQTAEVDRVMWTPLSELTRPGTYHLERWSRPPVERSLHFFELDDETVWGATAHMLYGLLQAADRSSGESDS